MALKVRCTVVICISYGFAIVTYVTVCVGITVLVVLVSPVAIVVVDITVLVVLVSPVAIVFVNIAVLVDTALVALVLSHRSLEESLAPLTAHHPIVSA